MGTTNKYNFETFWLGETEGVRTLTNIAGINPITLLLYEPTAKILDHTFLVFYPTIRGEIPLFYYYNIIPLLLFLSSPRKLTSRKKGL